jgi:exopolysaccharide production protein ExoQ
MTSTIATHRRVAAPGALETLLAGALLLLLAGGLVPLAIRARGGGGDGSSLSIMMQGAGCLLASLRLAHSPGGLRRAVERLDPVVLALLALLVASTAWSVDPMLTARRAAAVVAASLFGLYLADRWKVDEQMWLVLRVLTVAAVASAVMVLVLPSYGLADDGASWRGIFLTKNVLGRVMALGVVAGALCAVITSWPLARRRQASVCAVVCGLVMLQAGSVFATATVAAVLILVAASLIVLRASYPWRQAVGSLLFVGLGGGLVAAVLGREQLFDLVGRDANLTGRLPLWSSVWPAITDRPWLGHGWGAFWQGWEQPSTQAFLRNPWGPPHSHNGLLELLLAVGIVGAALWLLALLSCLLRALRQARDDRAGSSIWPIALVLMVLAFNLTEVTTMGNAFFWSLFVAASSSRTRRPAASLDLWDNPARRHAAQPGHRG